jgi:hypothetical protein
MALLAIQGSCPSPRLDAGTWFTNVLCSYGSDFEPGNGVIGAPWRAADSLAESTYGLYGYPPCQLLAGADGDQVGCALPGAHRIQDVMKPPDRSTRQRRVGVEAPYRHQ